MQRCEKCLLPDSLPGSDFDAIRTFFSTGLDALVMGDYLVLKKRGE